MSGYDLRNAESTQDAAKNIVSIDDNGKLGNGWGGDINPTNPSGDKVLFIDSSGHFKTIAGTKVNNIDINTLKIGGDNAFQKAIHKSHSSGLKVNLDNLLPMGCYFIHAYCGISSDITYAQFTVNFHYGKGYRHYYLDQSYPDITFEHTDGTNFINFSHAGKWHHALYALQLYD
jgi:hypothetical protein